MTYHKRVPLLLGRFHLHKIPAAAGHQLQTEEQPVSKKELHFPQRLLLIRHFLRRPNGASRTAAADWELVHEMAAPYEVAAASTMVFCLQWLNDAWDSPWRPCHVTAGEEDGDYHYESARSRWRWG
jgi:hypothetical protein